MADLYDCPVGAMEEGGPRVDARPGYRQVAAMLREQILSGERPPGSPLPAQTKLAAEIGADVAVVNRAVGQLASEGLVRVEHGRPTVVLAQHRYEAKVTIPRLEERGDAAAQDLADALRGAAEAYSAVSEPMSTAGPERVIITMIVLAADPARAAATAYEIARRACRDGWDLVGASVETGPARK